MRLSKAPLSLFLFGSAFLLVFFGWVSVVNGVGIFVYVGFPFGGIVTLWGHAGSLAKSRIKIYLGFHKFDCTAGVGYYYLVLLAFKLISSRSGIKKGPS